MRVMTMGEITGSIAHEINQPLGAIVSYGNACLRLSQRARFRRQLNQLWRQSSSYPVSFQYFDSSDPAERKSVIPKSRTAIRSTIFYAWSPDARTHAVSNQGLARNLRKVLGMITEIIRLNEQEA